MNDQSSLHDQSDDRAGETAQSQTGEIETKRFDRRIRDHAVEKRRNREIVKSSPHFEGIRELANAATALDRAIEQTALTAVIGDNNDDHFLECLQRTYDAVTVVDEIPLHDDAKQIRLSLQGAIDAFNSGGDRNEPARKAVALIRTVKMRMLAEAKRMTSFPDWITVQILARQAASTLEETPDGRRAYGNACVELVATAARLKIVDYNALPDAAARAVRAWMVGHGHGTVDEINRMTINRALSILQSATPPDSSMRDRESATPKPKAGRKRLDETEINHRLRLNQNWQAAHGNGTTKAEFCKHNGIHPSDLAASLQYERDLGKRKKNERKKSRQ